MNVCPECRQEFSRKDVMLRHWRTKHGKIGHTFSPPPPPPLSLIPIEPCSSILIAGPTGSGKSRWTETFLNQLDYLYTLPPQKILYCYGIFQSLFEDMERQIPHFTLHQGVPSMSEIDEFADGVHNLIVLDDLAHNVLDSKTMELLFTQGCHHKKLSVIFITQNIYGQGKSARTIALNCWYMILFKNIRGTSQIKTLGQQLFPGKSHYLVKSFEDATKIPFGYLMIDLSPRGHDEYRLRTRVFRDEDIVVYKHL